MPNKTNKLLAALFFFALCIFSTAQSPNQWRDVGDREHESLKSNYDVVIIGAGASGVTAAIQAARQGATVLLVEEGPWVGGMLTSAGVSAIDGNHKLAGGLWREFRDSLYAHYGGPQAVETGWVSNTLFEPEVGQRILRNMLAREANVTLRLSTTVEDLAHSSPVSWSMRVSGNLVSAKILIDATELGDVAAALGVRYDVGMDARAASGEALAPEDANDIVQDLTYVMTLRDYGEAGPHNISQPPGYSTEPFSCVCVTKDPASYDDDPRLDCDKMLAYGRLPNNRYMVN